MKQLLIVRHGPAGDPHQFLQNNSNDELRPLSEEGIIKTHSTFKGLSLICPKIDKIYHSPLTRTSQTAEILKKELHFENNIEAYELLKPGHNQSSLLNDLFKNNPHNETIAIVGHQPHMGQLLGLCLNSTSMEYFDFGKAATALIHFNQSFSAQNSELAFYLRASQLRKLK